MDAKETKEFRRRLSEEHAKLMESISRSLSAEKIEDEGGMATISQEKDLLFSLNESVFVRLSFIQAAFDALDRGDYGQCSRCGREIGKKRLMAIPWARTCIRCQETTEPEHISSRIEPRSKS